MNRVHLLRELVNEGKKIFTIKDAKEKAVKLGWKESTVVSMLFHLKKEGWIWKIKNGVYSITYDSGFGPLPHEYEISLALVSPSAISHWTALYYHHLTQQTPNVIFAITPYGTTIPENLPAMYKFIRITPDHYFGIKDYWAGESRVKITDPERTLLDGLTHPQYCGDFDEVVSAFKMRGEDLDLDKIINYSQRMSIAVQKRLGFILEYIGHKENLISQLQEVKITGYRKLNPMGAEEGKKNIKWNLIENV